MDVRDSLKRMVRVTLSAKQLHDAMNKLGYCYTPYFDIYAELIDAIYALIGEKTGTLEESVTYTALFSEGLSESERVDMLMTELERNEAHDQQRNGG